MGEPNKKASKPKVKIKNFGKKNYTASRSPKISKAEIKNDKK